jgi:2-aminoethylphosphonate-pyruvate transaminase
LLRVGHRPVAESSFLLNILREWRLRPEAPNRIEDEMHPPSPLLLTPGPLTTSDTVKQAMLRDWGSRDATFSQMNLDMRERLVELVNARSTHVCIPLQGSGTFAVEATLITLLAPADHLLVLVNGAYGTRMKRIAQVTGRQVSVLEWREDERVAPASLDEALGEDESITHVAVVHCETTSGILNPIGEIARVVQSRGRALIIDAMSTFGALEIDAAALPFAAVVASSNKCLEGVPGLGFSIVRRDALESRSGNAGSLALDLFDQWRGFEANGQWRFTPPTHVIAAFCQALDEHAKEGGVAARGARYRANHQILVDGMQAMGFRCLLARDVQAPIIVTFLSPGDPLFSFEEFYERLRSHGFLIYPGKLTAADSFRMGCIGHLGGEQMREAIEAVRAVLGEMGVSNCAPVAG